MAKEDVSKKDDSQITLSKDTVYIGLIFILLAVLAASVYTGGFGMFGKTNAVAVDTQKNETIVLNKAKIPDLTNLEVLGEATVPVLIVEYSDFQCPYCGIAWGREYAGNIDSRGSVQKIKSDYVQTGKANFVYYPVAGLGQESFDAAEAVFCADDQRAFTEYEDELFKNQNGENQGAFSKSNLIKFAGNIGLNAVEFEKCINGTAKEAIVKETTSFYESVIGTGTPTFFIAIKKGNVDLQKLKQITDQLKLASGPTQGQAPDLLEDTEGKYYLAPVVGAQGYSKIKQILDVVKY